MKKLRILFTNNALDVRGGSELVILDLAREFHRRGHMPVVYSRNQGAVAKTLKDAFIPVISDLNSLGSKPDIIHGQHHVEAMSAMLHFHDIPAIYVCHGWKPWQESPPVFSSIQRYVAVGSQTRESIVTSCGVPSEEVEIINNFVDMGRFQLKKDFREKPRSALILDNNVALGSGYAECVKVSCAKAGVERVDIIGVAAGNSTDSVHAELRKYDLVFALGRSALEAMSVGCSVIGASQFGAYGLFKSDNIEKSYSDHIGISLLRDEKLNESFLCSEILKYDLADSARVTSWVRKNADLSRAADRYEAVYHDAIGRWKDAIADARRHDRLLKEASRYVESLKPLLNHEKLKREMLLRKMSISRLKRKGIDPR